MQEQPTAQDVDNKRAAAVFAATGLDALCDALESVDRQRLDEVGKQWMRQRLIEEIERRCPEADEAVQQLYLVNEEATIADYIAVLCEAARAVGE
jgi:hypothetical protein